MKNSELVPVMLVRVPEISAEARTKLKAEIESSIYDEVVELPLPRDSPVELLEPESRPPKEPHGRNAAEKREILDRLYAYRKSAGLGCFEPLAEACGKGITPDLLRRLYSGDEVVPIQVWRQVGAGLGKLGVSKLDTNGG